MLTGTVSYMNGLASQYDFSSAGSVILGYQFSYNANMQVSQSIKSSAGSTNPVFSTYTWNTDGSLNKIANANSLSNWSETFIYSGGVLQQKDFTFSQPPTNSKNTNVSWIYMYNNSVPAGIDFDLNMDGSIDSKISVTLENGPCTPVYANIPDDIPGVGGDGKPGSAFGLTWCG